MLGPFGIQDAEISPSGMTWDDSSQHVKFIGIAADFGSHGGGVGTIVGGFSPQDREAAPFSWETTVQRSTGLLPMVDSEG